MTDIEAVSAVMAALEERLAHPWTLDALARHAQLSRSYLVRLFRRRTGLSPMAWLARRRAERAAVLLLTTTRTIAGIGAEVGWSDPGYFARRFRAAFGMAASDYRARFPLPATAPMALPSAVAGGRLQVAGAMPA